MGAEEEEEVQLREVCEQKLPWACAQRRGSQ